MDSNLTKKVRARDRREEVFGGCEGRRRRELSGLRHRATNFFTSDLLSTRQALYGEREESKEVGNRRGRLQQH